MSENEQAEPVASQEAVMPGGADEAGVAAPSDTAASTTASPDAAETTLAQRIADLERMLEAERESTADYMRRWQRAQADFSNFKRRAQQEQEQHDRLTIAQSIAPVLAALDSFERAFATLPPSLQGFSWIAGLGLVDLQLRSALERLGIAAIEAAPGHTFDSARHEPIGEVETSAHPAGAIAVVLQRGYLLDGMVIRPALVQIARAPAETVETARDAVASDEVPGNAAQSVDTPAPDEAAETT